MYNDKMLRVNNLSLAQRKKKEIKSLSLVKLSKPNTDVKH